MKYLIFLVLTICLYQESSAQNSNYYNSFEFNEDFNHKNDISWNDGFEINTGMLQTNFPSLELFVLADYDTVGIILEFRSNLDMDINPPDSSAKLYLNNNYLSELKFDTYDFIGEVSPRKDFHYISFSVKRSFFLKRTFDECCISIYVDGVQLKLNNEASNFFNSFRQWLEANL